MALCECGCGNTTLLYTQDSKAFGYVRGTPRRFINGHHLRGALSPRWKGGRVSDGYMGYIRIFMPDHPRANARGYVSEHILVASTALGRPIPVTAVVHHHNGVESDNRNSNLVICEDQGYHRLLHTRQIAVAAGHPASWRLCTYCKSYDAPENGVVYGTNFIHRLCHNERACLAQRAARRKKQEAQ